MTTETKETVLLPLLRQTHEEWEASKVAWKAAHPNATQAERWGKAIPSK